MSDASQTSKKRSPTKKSKGGAPRKEIDLKQLQAFMRMSPSLEDTAAFFKVSDRKISEIILNNYKISFIEFRNQNMVKSRHDLVRKALSEAKKGNTAMLIFCLKNQCGWRDRPKEDEDEKRYMQMPLNDLIALVRGRLLEPQVAPPAAMLEAKVED